MRRGLWFGSRVSTPAGISTSYAHRIKSFDLSTGTERGRLTLSRGYPVNDYRMHNGLLFFIVTCGLVLFLAATMLVLTVLNKKVKLKESLVKAGIVIGVFGSIALFILVSRTFKSTFDRGGIKRSSLCKPTREPG